MNKIILVGKPNSGKSLLFNRMTGLDQRVANFPGVTVQLKKSIWKNFELIDFPGSYSLNPVTKDEVVAVGELEKILKDETLSTVVCVLESTQLQRSLYFSLQVLKAARQNKKNVLFAFNMYDEILNHRLQIDFEGMQKEIGVPCLPISAKTGFGIEPFYQMLQKPIEWSSGNVEKIDFDAKKISQKYGPQTDLFVKKMNRLDQFFLSSIFGGPLFFAMMALLFLSLFTWSTPLMDTTESVIVTIGSFVSHLFPPGVLRDFVSGAIFGGVGTFVVFVPQIFILTFVLGLLEDSGYLARIAIICHRPLRLFGLSGKSFIPFLSGHACAIPAIFSARMIESPKKRLITLLTIPLISCSARLPIYSLLVIAFVPDTFLGGWLSLRGLIFFGLFILGYISAFAVSAILSRFLPKKENDIPFIIELPSYRRPFLKPLFLRSTRSAWDFLREAGPVIFFTTMIVWILGYFPNADGNLEGSWLQSLALWLEPVVKPLGLDWKFAVAILTSFIAREVFVGTLGTFYGIESADENVEGLSARLQQSDVSMGSGIALLVFYVIALQCISTLAVIRKETNSNKIPVILFISYTLLAYILALITYKILT
ncbi:ferrous iron transporter B [bacterium]|nr:ferrous iron transporter B [bacterium]